MLHERVRRSLVFLSVIALVLGPSANPLLSQSTSVTGRIAGRAFDKETKRPISGVTVNARLVTTNELFTSQETDARGSYLISDVPAGVYALSLTHVGAEYPVAGRFDVRAGMSFLLESCFELGAGAGTAVLRPECASGFYAESQVVSLGPHRYFIADPPSYREAGALTTLQELTIDHSGRTCIVKGSFPLFTSGIEPGDQVRTGRVYFRAAQHPDFYYVELREALRGFEAILPKPAPETTRVVYYILAVDLGAIPVQTARYFPEVKEDCEDDPNAAYFMGEDPGLAVGSTVPGAANVPPGFLPQGISTFITASGSTIAAGAPPGGNTGLVLIIGAGAVAAAVLTIGALGEEEASPP